MYLNGFENPQPISSRIPSFMLDQENTKNNYK